MKLATSALLGGLAAVLTLPAAAHHGVAGVGAAMIDGPGAPIESASSANLPQGTMLTYLKVDDARYKRYDWAVPNEKYSRFTMLGLGYGITPWLSAYAFLPYNEKIAESGGLSSRGWADMSLMLQLGFKYDGGWQLQPAKESLDDLEDWHFSVFGGSTLPTGNANHRLSDGSIDPGKSLGFGKPSLTFGATASKMLTKRLTLSLEASALRFQEYRYDNGDRTRFGAENRLNAALAYRAWSDGNAGLRFDPVIELQYLALGRDRTNGVSEVATGGRTLYGVIGARAYWRNLSVALGLKKPIATRLNESSQQQGSEGKEKYRLIFSLSASF